MGASNPQVQNDGIARVGPNGDIVLNGKVIGNASKPPTLGDAPIGQESQSQQTTPSASDNGPIIDALLKSGQIIGKGFANNPLTGGPIMAAEHPIAAGGALGGLALASVAPEAIPAWISEMMGGAGGANVLNEMRKMVGLPSSSPAMVTVGGAAMGAPGAVLQGAGKLMSSPVGRAIGTAGGWLLGGWPGGVAARIAEGPVGESIAKAGDFISKFSPSNLMDTSGGGNPIQAQWDQKAQEVIKQMGKSAQKFEPEALQRVLESYLGPRPGGGIPDIVSSTAKVAGQVKANPTATGGGLGPDFGFKPDAEDLAATQNPEGLPPGSRGTVKLRGIPSKAQPPEGFDPNSITQRLQQALHPQSGGSEMASALKNPMSGQEKGVSDLEDVLSAAHGVDFPIKGNGSFGQDQINSLANDLKGQIQDKVAGFKSQLRRPTLDALQTGLQDIPSGNVVKMGYDPMTNSLIAQFKNGQVYRYNAIDKGIVKQILESPSIGQAFHELIRSNPKILYEILGKAPK